MGSRYYQRVERNRDILRRYYELRKQMPRCSATRELSREFGVCPNIVRQIIRGDK